MKNYTVNLNYWVNGSGWSHGETFDHISEACTAEEYVRRLDLTLTPPVGCDDIQAEIWDDEEEKCISRAWVSEVYEEETQKDNLRTAISQLGGIKAVADRFEIPYRTVQNWSDGTRTPPTYVAKMIIEVEKQDRKGDESYKDYVEEQEALSWYETKLKEKKEKIEELEARNEVLFEQMEAMTELAQKRREHIEASEAAIDQLEKALDATREELAKERHAREVWASQAARFSNW